MCVYEGLVETHLAILSNLAPNTLTNMKLQYNLRTYGACGLCLTDAFPPTLVCSNSKQSLSFDSKQALTALWSALQPSPLLIKAFQNLSGIFRFIAWIFSEIMIS